MSRKVFACAPRVLPLFLVLQGGAALAFEPIKFDDGTKLDMSLQVNYVNMKRLKDPVTINRYEVRPSDQRTVAVTPTIKGTMWRPAVDSFTQWETKMNADDGTNAVSKYGTISNRVSALMDFNLSKDDYRAFLRLNAFRDQVIYNNNAGISPGTYNLTGPRHLYTQEARDYAGQRTRVLDAYVQGRWRVGAEGRPLFIKLGRQVVNWGEGLMFQGIGSSMNPNDQIKGQTPGVPAAEAFLPTEQIYGTLGVNEKLTLMAYKKWKFRPTEFAPVGTYWSADDLLGPGGAFQGGFEWQALMGNMFPNIQNYGAYRLPDVGKKNGGQWGLGLKYQWTDKLDLGLYHLRYTENVASAEFYAGTTYWHLNRGMVSGRPGGEIVNGVKVPYDINAEILAALNYLTPFPNSYASRYMNDIKLTGASFSTLLGDWQFAGEMAYRDGAPVMMGDHHYNVARGKTISANISTLRAWSGTEFLWGMAGVDSGIFGAEVAVQHLLSFEKPYYSPNPNYTPPLAASLLRMLAPNPMFWNASLASVPQIDAYPMTDKTGVAACIRMELVYSPFPEWELNIPIFYWRELVGMGPSPGGWNSGLTGKNSGRVSVETKFTYRKNLELGMTATHFLGNNDMRFHYFNPFSDRDFVALNAGYHF
ncbi:MAG: DUF1302 family protein [Sterolibacterium sp.]|nr:DUF1302 family protein [Sterolibacterium sp.]MBP9800096.1 DUF1302 family protein [Sterolibacterium sp.]